MSKYVDIHFRLKDNDEKEAITKAAKASGKTLSEYAREVLLHASDYEITEIEQEQHNREMLSANKSKKHVLYMRLSEDEINYYIAQAKEAGCSVSEYIRRSANNNQIVVIPGLKEITKQIAKLGVNLNQLTILAHQGKIQEVDLFSCNDTLKQILQKLIKLSKTKKG